jgi:hypothetical protein
MSLNDELDDILREFAEAQGIKMEEVIVEPLPKLTTTPLPPLKYRAKHLIDDGIDEPVRNKRKKKYKRKQDPYIRSARLHETNSKTNIYSMFTALTEEQIEPFHRESLLHCTLDEVPRCYCCGALPPTLGEFFYSMFTLIYKCDSCYKVFPHYFSMRKAYRQQNLFYPTKQKTK